MAENVSKTGVWLDSRTGKVVESQPEEGVQLVPKGGVVTPDAQRQIDALKAPARRSTEPVDLSVQEPVDHSKQERPPASAATVSSSPERTIRKK